MNRLIDFDSTTFTFVQSILIVIHMTYETMRWELSYIWTWMYETLKMVIDIAAVMLVKNRRTRLKNLAVYLEAIQRRKNFPQRRDSSLQTCATNDFV